MQQVFDFKSGLRAVFIIY